MKIEKTPLEGCYLLKPNVFKDERGSFIETYNSQTFAATTGINPQFVQDNQSISLAGTIRGLHFQTGDFAQAKLVRVIQGEVLDVVVDLRPNSPTFKKSYSKVLNATNNFQLFVPRGFAHGFSVLEQKSIFAYKCDNFYNKENEVGIYYADRTLNIDWNVASSDIIVSEKDKKLPGLEEYLNQLK